MELEIKEYLSQNGKSPFTQWLKTLDNTAEIKIISAIYKIKLGNLSNVKRLGTIYEYKLTLGPGYRIYFGKDGDKLIILLGGGSKKQQSKDIANAKERWENYLKQKGE